MPSRPLQAVEARATESSASRRWGHDSVKGLPYATDAVVLRLECTALVECDRPSRLPTIPCLALALLVV